MSSFNATQCSHIKTSGVRCGSPALSNRRYCYYHQRSRPIMLNFARDQKLNLFSLPTFEDAHAIQFTLRNVVLKHLTGNLDAKSMGLILYALQIASTNLKLMKDEMPKPEEVVVDVPQLSEIAPPIKLEEPVPLNSHTSRLTRFPEPPTADDEYQDDVKRQAREIREQFANQLLDDRSKAQNSGPPNAECENTQSQNQQSQNEQPEGAKSEQSHSNDDLAPGTIHACITSPRRIARNARSLDSRKKRARSG